MTPLPTLWVNPIESTGNARSGTWTRDPGDTTTRPYVARAEHVPASALDAANDALRLERAENKRLRALLASVRCGRCGGSGRYFPPCDFCADSTHDHECPPSSDCASCAGTGDRFHAALAPKESADE